ncbi:MAG: RNA polymerase sigma factor [Gammaproteobacteria bacterium]
MQDLTRAEEPDDASLARRIAAAHPGTDAAAEAALYRRLAPRVRLYGLRHLRDGPAATDLMQQVMLMTLEKLRAGDVREPNQIASFVLGMCRMAVLDLRRTGLRRAKLLQEFSDDVFPISAATAPDDLDHAGLLRCLDRLSERERSVMIMSFYDDQPAKSVAGELALSEANVRVIRHRALGKLRACMTGGDAES